MRRDKRRRWVLVGMVTALLLAVPALVAALAPGGGSADPARLRDLIARSASQPYQGYAESTGSLGLPDLPKLGDVTSLFNGTTRMRAWYTAPDRSRVDVLTVGSERDVYRLPDAEYTWDYAANQLTELIGDPPVRLPQAGDLLPPDLARRILADAPGDPVTALPGRRIAGIAAAGVRLTPRDPDTTVGTVDIWADPATGLPLRVELSARGQTSPVLTTAFEEVDLTTPTIPAEAPNPVPGSGFVVTSAPDVAKALGALGQATLPAQLAGRDLRTTELGGIRGVGLYGTGLSSFVVAAVPGDVGAQAADAATKAGAASIKLARGTAVAKSIPPLSLLVVRPMFSRRAYVLAGLVDPSVLQAAAGALTTLPRRGR
ncbi:hypothetical protein [Amycolatopsis sp.]|uniref:hypothetical protein n=1 Tax=Amycolatopsis sp. TaxID=37632 RepID=UPI002631FE92|nr:hypothetical protein [Amycolatopsis sp.]